MKKKSRPVNTCDIKWQNTPGREQIPNGATFQWHFPVVVAKDVFSFGSCIKPIWWYPDLRSREEKILQLCNLHFLAVMSLN